MIRDALAEQEIRQIVDDWFLKNYPRGYKEEPMPFAPLFNLLATVLDREKPDGKQQIQRVLDTVMEQLQARGL